MNSDPVTSKSAAAGPKSEFPPIVHVERDRHTRELVSLFLTRAGFTVEAPETGYHALDRVRRLGRALVITEILIPELDGLSLCRVVKSDSKITAAVVVLSMLSAGERARQAGADAFLMKPIDEGRLIATIRDLAITLGGKEGPTS